MIRIPSTSALVILLLMLLQTMLVSSSAAAVEDFSIAAVEHHYSPLEQDRCFQSMEDELEKDGEQFEELYLRESGAKALFAVRFSVIRDREFQLQAHFLSLLKVPIV